MKKNILLTIFAMVSFNCLSAYNRDYDRESQDNWLRQRAQDAQRHANEQYFRGR